ncbi:MAG: sialidase family protein [bacterium]
MRRTVLLPPGPGNPRNSEGDFIRLNDGRIMFIYTHFTGGGDDHAKAHLAARFSEDQGLSWTAEDIVVIPNEGDMNIMSVSLLRLSSGEIALFYLRKNSLSDCRPLMRISTDEAKTWSNPTVCITDEMGYYVVNNDRVVQLERGRLVIPASQHAQVDGKWIEGVAMCYLSDDNGKTWRRSKSTLDKASDGKKIDFQEPGVVELKDGRLMMFCRTREGCQYISFSSDSGETWSPPDRSNIISPLSPATIERIPSNGNLLLAWNDHSDIPENLRGKRTPFCVAISKDEGKTWEKVKVLENNPDGWYCYTAMDFVDNRVLLGHCAGNRVQGAGLAVTQITSFEVAWLYK